ncbi:MAG: FkbM family methyltransferase [Acidobacteria bacterium]|nr:FkbM family methyltransferase [Acidobacteriota bacterium]
MEPADWIDACISTVARRYPHLRGRGRLVRLAKHFRSGREVVHQVCFGDDTFPLILRPTDWIDECLHYNGYYERDEAALFDSLLRPGSTVLDIGANIGYYAVAAGRKVGDGRVIAFEPVPATYERLCRNLELNRCARVTPVLFAAADSAGERTIYLVDGDPGSSSFGPRAAGQSVLRVGTRRVDDVLAELGIGHVDLVKMDVEGAERVALEGMRGVLGRSRPAILMEINPPQLRAAGDSPSALLQLLAAYEYRLSRVGPGGVVPFDASQVDQLERNINVLAVASRDSR